MCRQTNTSNGETTLNTINEIGDDLAITKFTRQNAGTGAWVCGRLDGHRFEALVFPGHADDSTFELADSRISKLWIQRCEDKQTVFNWDRGMDQPATTDLALGIVDFLAAGLADFLFAE